jgi:hypothetical protein
VIERPLESSNILMLRKPLIERSSFYIMNAVLYRQYITGVIVAGVCKLRYGTFEAISRKQHFIVPAQTQ